MMHDTQNPRSNETSFPTLSLSVSKKSEGTSTFREKETQIVDSLQYCHGKKHKRKDAPVGNHEEATGSLNR